MEVYGLTDDQKADRLLDLAGLGDWKPSQLCAHMQGLTVGQDVLLHRIFLRQLPENVRMQVAGLTIDDLPALARKTDVIMAAKRAPAMLSASFQPLKKKLPPQSSEKSNLCWYHAKFGPKAGPVDRHVPSLPRQENPVCLRETGRPAPSGTGGWPKSKPSFVCVGPLPISQGMTYLFTIIDRYTRWPEAIPMADATAASCALAFLSHHIAQYGVPSDVSSDRGPQFTSNLWTALSKLLGAQLRRTTAYHPHTNGIVERFHRQLKAALKACLTGPAWVVELPLVLLGLRSAPKEDLGCAPSELLYGSTIRLPGEFFEATTSTAGPDVSDLLTQLRTTMARLQPTETSHHWQHTAHMPAELLSCKFVFVRHDTHRLPLQCTYVMGPFGYWRGL